MSTTGSQASGLEQRAGSGHSCRWWVDLDAECERPATHAVSKPGRHWMPLCSEHVEIYRQRPGVYVVVELPQNAPCSAPGSARCVRCGAVHPDMPLERLDEFGCRIMVPGTEKENGGQGVPCRGRLVAIPPNATPSATEGRP